MATPALERIMHQWLLLLATILLGVVAPTVAVYVGQILRWSRPQWLGLALNGMRLRAGSNESDGDGRGEEDTMAEKQTWQLIGSLVSVIFLVLVSMAVAGEGVGTRNGVQFEVTITNLTRGQQFTPIWLPAIQMGSPSSR
jgi:hypothetical protein